MFEDYQYHKLISFSNPVSRVAMAQNGTIVTQIRSQINITHAKGCKDPIQFLTYIKNQLEMGFSISCYGISSISLESKEQSRCCFGLILNSSFCLIVVSIVNEKQGLVQLQLERVKLMKFTQNEQVSSLSFISLSNKNRGLIQQKMINGSVNVIDIQSYDRLTGNFKYHKLINLKLGRRNQEQFGKWLWLRRNNIIYSVFADQSEDKLLITHQITRSQTEDIKIFIYSLSPNTEKQTYAQNILLLPTFQYETMLVDVLFVPTSEKPKIQTSQLLLFYQTDTGLEIVQTNYHAPNIVVKKHLYQNLIYLQLIASSIVPEEIYLQGIEFCLQHHTILLQTCKGIAQNHELTLLSLPSTASPQTINQKQIDQQFYVCKNGKDGIWVHSCSSLFQIKITKKPKIYQTLLKLYYPQYTNHLRAISNEVLQFLE